MRLSSAESVVNSFTCLSFRVGSSRLCYQLGDLPFRTSWSGSRRPALAVLVFSASVRGAPRSTPMKLLSHALLGLISDLPIFHLRQYSLFRSKENTVTLISSNSGTVGMSNLATPLAL